MLVDDNGSNKHTKSPEGALVISLPKVLLIGGDDVDARLELMHCLKDAFNVSALGSLPALGHKFSAQGVGYRSFHLSRQVNPLADLLIVGQLVFMLRGLGPQIVHAFGGKPNVWARLAARLAGVPIVIGTMTGLGSLYASDNSKTRLIRLVYQPLQTFRVGHFRCFCAALCVPGRHSPRLVGGSFYGTADHHHRFTGV
jgi:hypothetical protein